MKKLLKQTYCFYELKGAPFLAKYLRFIFWPIAKLLELSNVCFLANIATGTGHTTAEIDFFFRRLFFKEIPVNKRYLWIQKPNPYTKGIKRLYSGKGCLFIESYLLYALTYPLILAFSNITVDCGLSRLKWQLPSKKFQFPNKDRNYLWQLSKKAGILQLARYYKKCHETQNYFPLAFFSIKEFRPFSIPDKPFVIIQIKTSPRNATAKPTDPKTLLATLKYLKQLGFAMVFAGREKMPEQFYDYSLINYAESKQASFENDLYLFSKAEFAITSGSGIAFLADRMNKPYLYLNSWQLQMGMPSAKCIMVPTLIKKRSTNKHLKFKDQMRLYAETFDPGPENFPEKEYEAINASSEDILASLEELLQKCFSPTKLQKKYKQLAPDSPLGKGLSNCSHSFLKKHQGLL